MRLSFSNLCQIFNINFRRGNGLSIWSSDIQCKAVSSGSEYAIQRKAAIYIRTSSESQGEKAIPSEQEEDCRLLAKEKGLTVVHVYHDIEKYRVKDKLVEPSGSRADRPGLLAMLKDTSRSEFDVILAWREDRLYRGLRSMLRVLETVQQYNISILLVKEMFDP